MPSLIAKVTSHAGQTGVRSCRSICRGTPKFRPMVFLRNFRFFAVHSGEIAFSASFPCNLISAPGRLRGPLSADCIAPRRLAEERGAELGLALLRLEVLHVD